VALILAGGTVRAVPDGPDAGSGTGLLADLVRGDLVIGLVRLREPPVLEGLRLGRFLMAVPPLPPAALLVPVLVLRVLVLPTAGIVIVRLSHEAISFPRRRGSAATRVRAQTIQIV